MVGFFLGRLRKPLEKLRPPFATELLLSNDGDRILEGCLTNFFVVCRKVRFLDFLEPLCSTMFRKSLMEQLSVGRSFKLILALQYNPN